MTAGSEDDSRKARPTLAEIWLYVAVEASKTLATRLIGKIKNDCGPLRHFPLAAPSRESFAPGLRVSFSGNYAIYFLSNGDELTIVRVLRGARRSGFGEGQGRADR